MNERSSGLWIVALVALAGLFHVVPGPAPAPPGRGSAESTETEASTFGPAPNVDRDPVQTLLADHYLTNPSSDDALRRFKAENGRVLIALVPDPLDNHATHRFDEAIEALQAGFVSSGYLLDRFCLPWPRKIGGKLVSACGDAEAFRSHPSI